jgi:hypothetical protein
MMPSSIIVTIMCHRAHTFTSTWSRTLLTPCYNFRMAPAHSPCYRPETDGDTSMYTDWPKYWGFWGMWHDLQSIQRFPDIVSAEQYVANGFKNHHEYFQTLIASYSIDMASMSFWQQKLTFCHTTCDFFENNVNRPDCSPRYIDLLHKLNHAKIFS